MRNYGYLFKKENFDKKDITCRKRLQDNVYIAIKYSNICQ